MKELYAALVAAQAAVQPVGKGSTNSHHNYKYASGDDVVAEARRVLNAAGLAVFSLVSTITETPFSWEDEKGVSHEDVALRLFIQFRIVHTSGESHDFEPFSVPVLPERGRPIDKAEAGARTYALSYFLRELLLIPRVDESAKGGEAEPDTRDDRSYEPRRQKPAAKPAARPTTPAVAPTPAAQVPPTAAAPAKPKRSLSDTIRAGVSKAEDLARQAAGEWPAWLSAELDRIGMACLEPEQADQATREHTLEAIKVIVAKLDAAVSGQEAA